MRSIQSWFQPYACRVVITTVYFEPRIRTLLTIQPRGIPGFFSSHPSITVTGSFASQLYDTSPEFPLLLTIGTADDGIEPNFW